MHELAQAVPDADVLIALEPEQLGSKLLFLLRKRKFQRDMFHPGNLFKELCSPSMLSGQQTPYPRDKWEAIEIAWIEAWAWLEAQGLVVPSNGGNGWRVLSRRARRFESEMEFANYTVARMLRREALNPRIADKVWSAFMRGEFDVAVFQAMKTVEVAVREASGLPDNVLGKNLMEAAFSPTNGSLTDKAVDDDNERKGRMFLFVGAIACYKNPHSHRDIDLNDAAEASEIILLANHLLRIVDARAKAKAATP